MCKLPCLCDNRTDITCNESHCDLAGPGEPGNPNQCRVCWIRLGLDKTPSHSLPQSASSSPEGPGLFTKAGNFLRSAITHVAQGLPKVSQAEKEARLALCIVCPEYNQRNDTCKLCGCNLSIKAGWADQHCPLKKW